MAPLCAEQSMLSLFGNEKEKKEPSLLERLKQSVSKTRTELAARVEQLLTGDRPVDPELLRQLENALLSADIGVRTTKEIIVALRQQVNEHKLADASDLRRELKNQVLKILTAPAASVDKSNGAATNNVPTRVLFVVGVNGTGKTTTIGKLANRLKKEGATVVLCAADTFRAPAPN
jgi:fused signal recognition particle receptor